MQTLRVGCLTIILVLASSLGAQSAPQIIGGQGLPPPPPISFHEEGAVLVSGGVMAGQLIKKVLPASLPCGVGGMVVTHAIIGTDGKIGKLALISGPTRYGYADRVMNAIRQWEYKPYLIDGEPVKVDTTISLVIDTNGCPPSER